MTTSPPTPARSALGPVGTTVGEHIARLQHGYRNDRSEAVAALARLRRGIGKHAGELPDLWGLTGAEPLYEQQQAGALPAERIEQAEEAAYTAVTLWALHQQSQRILPMHQSGGPELGAAVRRLITDPERGEPVRKRFVRVGTATSLPILAQRLREIILLLRAEDIPLDYGRLADQLYRWQQPGGPEEVRSFWGRAYHASRSAAAGSPDGNPDPDSSPAGTDMPDSGTATTPLKDAQ